MEVGEELSQVVVGVFVELGWVDAQLGEVLAEDEVLGNPASVGEDIEAGAQMAV